MCTAVMLRNGDGAVVHAHSVMKLTTNTDQPMVDMSSSLELMGVCR